MQIAVRLMAGEGDSVPLVGTGVAEGAALWRQRLEWMCDGRRLDLWVIAVEPVSLPEPEPTEPVPGAIARVLSHIRGNHVLTLLANPAEALGVADIRHAQGIRMFAIATEADRACWDAALGSGHIVYGIAGDAVCEVTTPRPASVISALAYGGYVACDGLVPTSLLEDRKGVTWEFATDTQVTVIIKNGFEAQRFQGKNGQWVDRGSEGCVRLEATAASGQCWTQPRFIAAARS